MCIRDRGKPVGWRELVFNGTFYHLWYLTALLLALPIARLLAGTGRTGWAVAGLLDVYKRQGKTCVCTKNA